MIPAYQFIWSFIKHFTWIGIVSADKDEWQRTKMKTAEGKKRKMEKIEIKYKNKKGNESNHSGERNYTHFAKMK